MDTVCKRIRAERILSLRYQKEEPGFFFAQDSDTEARLVYLAQGSVHWVFNGCETVLTQGDFVLLAPGQWYMAYADTDSAPQLLTIAFAAEADWGSIAVTPPSPAVSSLLESMLQEHCSAGRFSQDMIFLLLGQLLIVLCREGRLSPAQSISGDAQIICRAQRIIHELSRKKLSVPVAAKKSGVSPSYLTALFHKHLHIAPGEYIRRVKLEESKQMIREGQLNFTQIASTLEYSTVHHFSRQFKEKFGITPTQYARSVR